jgi:hypothetical protein
MVLFGTFYIQMSRNIQFPPLNKRFTLGVKPEDIKIIDGRDKPDDKYDRFRESIGANNRVPKLVNKKRGLYNPTDIKRPAGIPGELKPRAAFLFKGDKERQMADLDTIVSEKGLSKLAQIFGDIEINDPSDDVWMNERARIVKAKTAEGMSPKQIDDYLSVNKPLGRDQNKVKRNGAIYPQVVSKDEQIAIIQKSIQDGLSSTLDGQVAMLGEVVKLLGRFGSKITQEEEKMIQDSIAIIKPDLTWRNKPIERRFITPDEFNHTNPIMGFILALILQNHLKTPLRDLIEISDRAGVRGLGLSKVNSIQQLFVNMSRGKSDRANRVGNILLDLDTNMIIAYDEIYEIITGVRYATIDNMSDRDLLQMEALLGKRQTENDLIAIDIEESKEMDDIKRYSDDLVNIIVAKLERDINDLRGSNTGGDVNGIRERMKTIAGDINQLSDEIDLTSAKMIDKNQKKNIIRRLTKDRKELIEEMRNLARDEKEIRTRSSTLKENADYEIAINRAQLDEELKRIQFKAKESRNRVYQYLR